MAEGGSIVYTASLTGPALSAVTVTLASGVTISIAAGASSGSVSVAAPSDDAIVDASDVIDHIVSASGGNFESLVVDGTPVDHHVTDTIDITTVSLTASPSVAEGGSITYTASLTAPAASAVTVTLSNGATITIAAGSSSGSVSVSAPGDDVYADGSIVTASIATATGGGFENLVANTTAVRHDGHRHDRHHHRDADRQPQRRRGRQHRLHREPDEPCRHRVTVTLSNGATINIAAGASSGTVSVPAPADDVYVDASSVSSHDQHRHRRQLREPGGQRHAGDDQHHRHGRHQPPCR